MWHVPDLPFAFQDFQRLPEWNARHAKLIGESVLANLLPGSQIANDDGSPKFRQHSLLRSRRPSKGLSHEGGQTWSLLCPRLGGLWRYVTGVRTQADGVGNGGDSFCGHNRRKAKVGRKGEGSRNVVDGSTRDARCCELSEPMVTGVHRQQFSHEGKQLGPVRARAAGWW